MDKYDLKLRTRSSAVEVFSLCGEFPRTYPSQYVARQLARCGASVAANYRAACRARSRREFIAKISIVIEEADESEFWLEFAGDLAYLRPGRLTPLLTEVNELLSVFVVSRSTAKDRMHSTE
jgi:four helix bundle protein